MVESINQDSIAGAQIDQLLTAMERLLVEAVHFCLIDNYIIC